MLITHNQLPFDDGNLVLEPYILFENVLGLVLYSGQSRNGLLTNASTLSCMFGAWLVD